MLDSASTHERHHMELVPGVIIGPWVICERWDRGSFGWVFKVTRAGHPEAGVFALKIALYADDPRFPREVALLQRTLHRSIPRFEDRGWWKSSSGRDFPYLVMEWVEGLPLYEWARQQKPTSAQLLQLLAQLAGALAAAHAAGGVHRDVKGDNVLMTAEGRAVLLDWGGGTHQGAKAITDTVLPPGTSSYRAPEAVRWAWAHRMTGEPYPAGPPDDVYALGVTGYRLCTGTYPPAPEEGSVPQRRLLPPRELATVSTGLDRLLMACLSQDRRARPPAVTLAIGLSAAAAERDAAAVILPTPAAKDTDTTSKPGPQPRWRWPDWASTAVAAMAGGLMAGALLLLAIRGGGSNAPAPVPAWEPPAHLVQPPPEAPDGGVAEEALASVQDATKAMPQYFLSYGRPMPSKPLPGQKKPPCERGQKAINGACWIGPLKGQSAPCGDTMFDYAGECYFATGEPLRQPTSEEPR